MPEPQATPTFPKCSNCGATTAYGCDECGPDSVVEICKADLLAMIEKPDGAPPSPLPAVAPTSNADVPKPSILQDGSDSNVQWFDTLARLAGEYALAAMKDAEGDDFGRSRKGMLDLVHHVADRLDSLRAALARAAEEREQLATWKTGAMKVLVAYDNVFRPHGTLGESLSDTAARKMSELDAARREARELREALRSIIGNPDNIVTYEGGLDAVIHARMDDIDKASALLGGEGT